MFPGGTEQFPRNFDRHSDSLPALYDDLPGSTMRRSAADVRRRTSHPAGAWRSTGDALIALVFQTLARMATPLVVI